jgi:hypothetical protein
MPEDLIEKPELIKYHPIKRRMKKWGYVDRKNAELDTRYYRIYRVSKITESEHQ